MSKTTVWRYAVVQNSEGGVRIHRLDRDLVLAAAKWHEWLASIGSKWALAAIKNSWDEAVTLRSHLVAKRKSKNGTSAAIEYPSEFATYVVAQNKVGALRLYRQDGDAGPRYGYVALETVVGLTNARRRIAELVVEREAQYEEGRAMVQKVLNRTFPTLKVRASDIRTKGFSGALSSLSLTRTQIGYLEWLDRGRKNPDEVSEDDETIPKALRTSGSTMEAPAPFVLDGN